ncbi:MAG: PatB family C-S lyase [Oscillospiraceae bacterium]|jgi:cystathionine beta-lyase|nr:PatB family C-S lyase [Oscillospiraceae bacterium]
MTYHFDDVIDRRGTCSLKFDFATERRRPADVLPLWVADMDFAVAQEILEAAQRAVTHGIWGYTETKAAYFEALDGWFGARFGYRVDQKWVIKTPGVVTALALAVQAYTQPGDAVLIQQPVYYPFASVVVDNRRRLVNSPLVLRGGRYEIDFDDFEAKIAGERVKLFLLCSPHNPVGRVWRRQELTRMAEICLQHGVVMASDEIHCDFAWEPHKHIVLPTLGPEIAQNCVLCTSAAKTFNIAGLQVSNIIIENPALRQQFQQAVDAIGYSQVNTFGLLCTQAAYLHGDDWLRQARAYIRDNIEWLRAWLPQHLPQVQLIIPEGTFLLWLDFRASGVPAPAQRAFLEQKAHLWLDSGSMFGSGGDGFQRINAACPRATLAQAMTQLKSSLLL